MCTWISLYISISIGCPPASPLGLCLPSSLSVLSLLLSATSSFPSLPLRLITCLSLSLYPFLPLGVSLCRHNYCPPCLLRSTRFSFFLHAKISILLLPFVLSLSLSLSASLPASWLPLCLIGSFPRLSPLCAGFLSLPIHK